jgi:hypothetical protein
MVTGWNGRNEMKANERGRVDHWQATLTDTFGGEANFSWVRRYEFSTPAGASQRSVMRAAKAAANMTGAEGRTENDGGDGYIFRPRAECTVLFVEWQEAVAVQS